MTTRSRNGQTAAAAVKLGIFTLASVFVTGLLTVIMGNVGFGDTDEYRRSSPRRASCRRATTCGSPA
jgi:hypothetical protein